jgi:hypothetical protein
MGALVLCVGSASQLHFYWCMLCGVSRSLFCATALFHENVHGYWTRREFMMYHLFVLQECGNSAGRYAVTHKNISCRNVFVDGCAEAEGFEPPVGFPTTVFKTVAFDHSATPPDVHTIAYFIAFDTPTHFMYTVYHTASSPRGGVFVYVIFIKLLQIKMYNRYV